MLSFSSSGDFSRTERFLSRIGKGSVFSVLDRFGREGVNALASATPVDSGLTADSWTYAINQGHRGYTITWSNSHVVDGQPIAILLQFGHGTGTGGYVRGRDYINPAIHPIFDQMTDAFWKEVTSS